MPIKVRCLQPTEQFTLLKNFYSDFLQNNKKTITDYIFFKKKNKNNVLKIFQSNVKIAYETISNIFLEKKYNENLIITYKIQYIRILYILCNIRVKI